MRGLLAKTFKIDEEVRYNPAYAGTTAVPERCALSWPIQPRVCGDYWVPSQLISSICRYNPAYAGTTHPCRGSCRVGPIQPRVCGDYDTRSPVKNCARDTTPRMRGLHRNGCEVQTYRRYNPAYAGTTCVDATTQRGATIQPRVCGDYRRSANSVFGVSDTTPRMRGLRRDDHRSWRATRYNPAYAGTTPAAVSFCVPVPIQPRVCGDYLSLSPLGPQPFDTTPRMRGLRSHGRHNMNVRRYNPAYAGTTLAYPKTTGRREIQPRVCGDYSRRTFGGLRSFRYNPAYAGTTAPLLLWGASTEIQPRVCGDYCYREKGGGNPAPIQPRVCGDYSTLYGTPLRYADTTPRMRGLQTLTS